jgi:hypothetical protein
VFLGVGFALCAHFLRLRLTVLAECVPLLRVLLWLGVWVHECGHALACLLTLTRIRQMQVRWHSGFVKHDARGWLISAIISTGPIASATLVAFLATSWLYGPSLLAVASGFRFGLLPGIEQGARGLLHLVEGAGGVAIWRWVVLVILAGTLSAASPSPPDLRSAAPGLALGGVLLIIVEAVSTALLTHSPVTFARPWLASAAVALGVALYASVLGAIVVWPLSLLIGRR